MIQLCLLLTAADKNRVFAKHTLFARPGQEPGVIGLEDLLFLQPGRSCMLVCNVQDCICKTACARLVRYQGESPNIRVEQDVVWVASAVRSWSWLRCVSGVWVRPAP